jgi:hypothetical protein
MDLVVGTIGYWVMCSLTFGLNLEIYVAWRWG